MKLKLPFYSSYVVGEEFPLYIRWIIWCWHQPIYIGLPLSILFIPIILIDITYLIVYGLSHWGGKKRR